MVNEFSRSDAEALKARIRNQLNANIAAGQAAARNGQGFPNPAANGYNMPRQAGGYQGNAGARRSSLPNQNLAAKAKGKQTLNHEEFHGKNKVYGSTGTYNDMEGGAHFSEYDCGHEYNDSVLRDFNEKKKPDIAKIIQEAFHDKNQVRNAFIMSEVFERGRRRRYSEKFR